MSFFLPACIMNGKEWCWSGKVGDTQKLDKEMDRKLGCSIQVVLLKRSAVLKGDHSNKETEMMREQTNSKKCELLHFFIKHLIAFRIETAKFSIVFYSSRKQMKVLAGSVKGYSEYR